MVDSHKEPEKFYGIAMGVGPGTGGRARSNVRNYGQWIVGLGFIAIGVLFFLDEISPFQAWIYVMRFWPTLLVVHGVSKLIGGHTLNGKLWGGFWCFVGVWMLLDQFDIVNISIFDFWPLVFVVLGLSIVLRSVGRSASPVTMASGQVSGPGAGTESSTGPATFGDAHLSAFALWSSVDRRYTSQMFQGGEATAIMGGCEIDLRQAALPEGQPVTVDLFAMWGAIDLRVPGDWSVRNETMAILGAVEDSRKEVSANPTRQLILRGTAVMGGIEIKN